MSRANLLLHVDELAAESELFGELGGWRRTGRQVYCEVLSQSGREFENAQAMTATLTHLMRCAYFAGANARMRLSTGEVAAPTRAFNVESAVNEREQNRTLLLSCVEVV